LAADGTHVHPIAAAWLTTVITRCASIISPPPGCSAETYVGPWLPEPILKKKKCMVLKHTQLSIPCRSPLLVLLETLSPTEPRVFLLREVFDCEFSEIASSGLL